ncbi:MAG: hypothetical protein HY908_23055 [Myxococcales bacterium]|nr:hypothetical protein [Myxococcales bacterium]
MAALLAALGGSWPGGRALAQPASAPAEDPHKAKARELFTKGSEAQAKGDHVAAIEAFRKAWAEYHSYMVAVNLSASEIALGRWADAATYLTLALGIMEADASVPRAEVDAARAQLADAKRHVGAVRVTVELLGEPFEGAELLVDGVPAEPCDPLYLEQGSRKLVARASGAGASGGARVPAGAPAAGPEGAGLASAPVELEAKAGGSHEVVLRLMLARRPEVAVAGPAEPAPSDGRAADPLWPGILGGVASSAALVLGAVGLGLSAGSSSDADELASSLAAGGTDAHLACGVTGAPGACADWRDAESEAGTWRAVGVAGLGAGLVGWALTGAYLGVRAAHGSSAEVAVVPLALREGGGALVGGRF